MNAEQRSAAELVVLTTFGTLWPAEILVARLLAEGIAATIPDRHIANANAFMTNAIGGIRVMVPAGELLQAKRIASAIERGEFALTDEDFDGVPDEIERCPACHSTRVFQDDSRKRRALAAVFLLGIPLPFSRKDRRCAQCDHRWRTSSS